MYAEKGKSGIATEKKSAVDKLMGSLGRLRICRGESGLANSDENGGIASGNADVCCRSAQTFTLHPAKFSRRESTVQVLTLGGIDEIAKSVDVYGLNLG
jgi:hypothetical protein